MFRSCRARAASLALASSLAVALSGGCVEPNSGSGDTGESCTPGRSVQCACPDGSSGAQVCGADGFWKPCRCDGATPGDAETFSADTGTVSRDTVADGETTDVNADTDAPERRVDPRNSGGGLDDPVFVRGNSEHTVLDRLLVSPPKGEFVDSYLLQVFGDETTVQNSVFRNTLGDSGEDRYCVSLSGETRNFRLVSNELYDCTDGIQFTGFTDRPRFTGATVAHNDMYLTPRYFSDGNGNRGSDNSGDWTCGDNAVDIKAGSKTSSNPVRIVGNRMWNFSDADTDCASSGTGARANAVTIHNAGAENSWTTSNIRVRNNIIFEVESGVGVSWSKNVEVSNNFFYSFGYKGADSGFASKDGGGVVSYKSDPIVFSGNTFVDGKTWSKLDSDDTLRNTVVVDGGSIDAKWNDPKTSGNAYYGNSTPWEDNPAIDKADASAAEMEKSCVTLRGYTSPRQRCFPNAVPTSASPHGTSTGFVPPTR